MDSKCNECTKQIDNSHDVPKTLGICHKHYRFNVFGDNGLLKDSDKLVTFKLNKETNLFECILENTKGEYAGFHHPKFGFRIKHDDPIAIVVTAPEHDIHVELTVTVEGVTKAVNWCGQELDTFNLPMQHPFNLCWSYTANN
ncbi:hypothetical protein [Pseudomonas aeruginosa]|uniref:hypothetical protein n=1 Tax=Pseudomonas aeruginosa TaxID=287 RepID=UPI001CA4C8EF|nr:hypothetical protein [Pseudomonas aeruginosa]MBW6066030.1 hypothetical protein [Pseudomonas aeruginosa]